MQLIKHLTTSQIMSQVIYALMPVLGIYIWLFGLSIIIQIILASIAAIIIDFSFAKLYKQNAKNLIMNYSSILTALLLAFSIPTIAPWWLIIVGVFFALIFAKYIYGGLGNNIFNPAMVGYVFLLISYPAEMVNWQIPMNFIDFSQIFNINFNSDISSISGATLLDSAKNNLPTFATQNNTILISIASILSGIYLLWRKIINWHIPVAVIIASIITIIIINFTTNASHNIMFHLFAGGFMFAIFFITTDPVTASASNFGRLIYGALIGFLIIIIRIFGNYPDGIAFAILLANMFVPLIDYYIRPTIFTKT